MNLPDLQLSNKSFHKFSNDEKLVFQFFRENNFLPLYRKMGKQEFFEIFIFNKIIDNNNVILLKYNKITLRLEIESENKSSIIENFNLDGNQLSKYLINLIRPTPIPLQQEEIKTIPTILSLDKLLNYTDFITKIKDKK